MSIVTIDGRTFSVRTKDEEIALLEKEIASLSPEEKETLMLLMKEAETGGKTTYEEIAKLEYKRELVPIEQFVYDPYYLGNTCDTLFPKLLKDLEEIFYGGYHEVVFGGSIGWGKTFTASIGVCRLLYELSCLVNPQNSYGIGEGSNMSIVGLSVNEQLATKVVFENISTKISASPYFTEHFPFKQTKKELRFPGNIWVAARATTDSSALGLNTIGAIIDETNFITTSKADLKHKSESRPEFIYNMIKRRMKSRFLRNGQLPSKLFVVSSKNTQNDFTAKLLQSSKKDPTVFARDYALWDVHPEDRYSEERFHVLSGNDQVASKILAPGEKEQIEGNLPEGCVIVPVPVDFRTDFEKDINGALKDLAGVATIASAPFISQRDKIQEAIDPTMTHPFSVEVYDQSKGGQFLWGVLTEEVSPQRRRGTKEYDTKRPRINPKAPRHVHIDLGLTEDSAGFCMTHVAGWKDVERRTRDGKLYWESAPHYVVDFMLQTLPPVGGEIVIGDLRRLIYELHDAGFPITTVTMDRWNSADTLQQLSAKGFKTYVESVDVTMDPYENLKTAIYEGRVSMYAYSPVLVELQTLEVVYKGNKKKVDHPPTGSKDVADALAATCWTLLQTRSNVVPVPILPSLPQHGSEAWLPEQRQSVVKQDNTVLPPFLLG